MLTIKQEKFVLKYFECGNATEAYKHAYDASKMTDKSINESSSKLLNNTKVTSRLQELRDSAQQRTEVTVDKLVQELAKIAFLDVSNYLDISDSRIIIKDLIGIDKSVIASASEVFDKEGMRVGVELKFHDKLGAIEKLMKHLGAYTQKVEISGEFSLKDFVKEFHLKNKKEK